MLQLPSDLGFFEESRPNHRLPCPLGPQLLQRHFAAETCIARQPYSADSSCGMQTVQRVFVFGIGSMVNSGNQDVAVRHQRRAGKSSPDVGVTNLIERLADLVCRDTGECSLRVSLVFG